MAPKCSSPPNASAIEGVSGLSLHLRSRRPPRPPPSPSPPPKTPKARSTKRACTDVFAPIRKVRIDAPPGLVGDPNTLGDRPAECTSVELTLGECPNGSQIGIVKTVIYKAGEATLTEPLYMMVPAEGSGAIARIGFAPVPGAAIYANVTVRSEGDSACAPEIEAPDLRTSGNDLIASEDDAVGRAGRPGARQRTLHAGRSLQAWVHRSVRTPPAEPSCPSSPTRPAAGRRSKSRSPPPAMRNPTASTPKPRPWNTRSTVATGSPSTRASKPSRPRTPPIRRPAWR